MKCIGAETLILTVTNGWVPASNIVVGEKLFTVVKEAMNDGLNLQDFTITGSNFTETEVVKVEVSKKKLIQFNDVDAKFSENQPMFVKVGDKVSYKNSGDVQIGDILVWVEEDPSEISYLEVTSITKTEDEHDVYDIRTSDIPWYIAGHFLTIA